MNWDEIEGQWDKLKGDVKSRWGKFTDDDMLRISGKKDKLLGVLKTRYGYEKDKAEREIDTFLNECDSKCNRSDSRGNSQQV